ncbi:uncharacterized protein LOC129220586 [Uloborus diversus]|uniref:uncharacterized protein LOC129220586 n=1 Tax=Uloborus diversus TaxID=327109 RepID=UPI0024094B01|nr:uncharacterized protein LOC129220586 [Uloborus diversus]
MSREQDRRAAILESLRAGKSPKEIIEWLSSGVIFRSVEWMLQKWLTVMHTKFPAAVIVLGVISSEGDVMPPHFFEEGLRINVDGYIHVLETVVKPWMDMVAAGRDYVFQQDSAPAHKSRNTQAWLHSNVPYHWTPDLWPPSSPDCNPLDYYFWGVVEEKINAKFHNTKDAAESHHY